MSNYARQRLYGMLAVAVLTFTVLLAVGKGLLYASLFIAIQAVLSVAIGNAWIRLTNPRRRVDPWETHRLEYEVGIRDDPPPPRVTDKPGAIIPVTGPPPSWMRPPDLTNARERRIYVKEHLRPGVRYASPAETRAVMAALGRHRRRN